MTNPQHRQSMTYQEPVKHEATASRLPTSAYRTSVEYWGLRRIAERMNCSVDYLRKLCDTMYFPLVLLPNPRRKHPKNLAFRWVYYTNENLIANWYLGLTQGQRNLRRKLGGRFWKHLGKGTKGD